MSSRIQALFNSFQKRPLFKHGIPFVLFVVGFSFVMKQFTSVRYEVSKHKQQLGVSDDLLEKMGIDPKSKSQMRQTTLEEEYEQYKKNVDLDKWQNIRPPRPWEKDNKAYKEVIEQRIKEKQDKSKTFTW